MKKITPNSLFTRFLLIIAVPTIIVQIVAIYVFYYTHVDRISKHMARSVINEMQFMKDMIYDHGEDELLDEFVSAVDIRFSFYKSLRLRKKARISRENYERRKILGFIDPLPIFDPLNRFKIELQNSEFTPFAIYNDPNDEKRLLIKVELEDGVLEFSVASKRIDSSSKTIFILWMIFTALLTSFISIVFLRNQVRSITDLSNAADKFGRSQDVPGFKPSGAREIRSAGLSILKMKDRIFRQVSQRTDMLSGVSHDLRTPITRMKLQLEMMGDADEIKDLKNDLNDMEKMVNEYLNFASGNQVEEVESVRIKEFLEKIISYYKKSGHKIDKNLALPSDLQVNLKEGGMQRAIRNLIDNAFTYGKKVVLEARIKKDRLYIVVDDDGPGVSQEERRNIFKPFYRTDSSRNLDKTSDGSGGAGLGLSIVLDIISSHGGKVEALRSPMGGLRVAIYLPI